MGGRKGGGEGGCLLGEDNENHCCIVYMYVCVYVYRFSNNSLNIHYFKVYFKIRIIAQYILSFSKVPILQI